MISIGDYLVVGMHPIDSIMLLKAGTTGALATFSPVLKTVRSVYGIGSGVNGKYIYTSGYLDFYIDTFEFSNPQNGLYVTGANTNLIKGRQSLETWAAGSPTGWVETNGGACNWTQDLTTRADNRSSALVTEDGAGTILTGPCSTGGIGAEIDYSAYAKKVTGTPTCTLSLAEYSVADCTGALATTAIVSPTLTTSWAKYEASWNSWNASTLSWTPIISCTTATAASSNWDAISIRSTSAISRQDSFCSVDADTTAVCAKTAVTGTNTTGFGNFKLAMTVNTPYSWAGVSQVLFEVAGTSGDNNRIDLLIDDHKLTFMVWSSAGSAKTASVACYQPTGAVDVAVKAYHSAAGQIWVCCGAVCSAKSTGATMAAVGTTFSLGGSTFGSDVWIKNFKIYRNVR